MDEAEAHARLEASRVGRLATVRGDGRPHIVPITFAVAGGRLVTMVDHKPKTTDRLQRIDNVEATGVASVLVDHYSEDWSELWWVRVDGPARVVRDGRERTAASDALATKYPIYEEHPPRGPAIVIDIERITSWASRA